MLVYWLKFSSMHPCFAVFFLFFDGMFHVHLFKICRRPLFIFKVEFAGPRVSFSMFEIQSEGRDLAGERVIHVDLVSTGSSDYSDELIIQVKGRAVSASVPKK